MRHFSYFTRVFLLLCLSFITMLASDIMLACSRVLHVDSQQAVMVGRTMDWEQDMRTQLWVYPRGIVRQGGDDANPLRWTSQYGSIVATAYQQITTDGFNERGLAAHLLWLSDADYGKRNEKIPGLVVTRWAQFYLDNFQTVQEAIRFTEQLSFQLVKAFQQETHEWVRLHLALEDATGDSAIIEYIDGKTIIYHSRDYIVLTNGPVYNKQLENLHRYNGLGGNLPLPGTLTAKDRFVRAAYYTLHLPHAASAQAELANVLAVVRNVSVPKQLPRKANEQTSWTMWRSVSDLTNHVYYFDDSAKPNLIWANLNAFNLSSGSPIMKLDLTHDYVGDVSKQFQPIIIQ